MSIYHSDCFCNRVRLRPNDRNMQTQHIVTCWAQHCLVQHVARVWPPCCDMLGVVGSSLKMVRFDATTPSMSQHVATGCMAKRTQQCCDMLCWHVAIVWPGLQPIRVQLFLTNTL